MTDPERSTRKGKKGAKYSPEVRAKAVADMQAGSTPREVAEKYGVGYPAALYWRSVAAGPAKGGARKGAARGGSRGGTSRLRFAMAKRVKDHIKQHVRDGGDLGEFETDVLALCNDVMRGDEEDED